MTQTSPHVPAGTVVVGVDGSQGAAAALDWAVEQARLERRPLTLVHGWPHTPDVWLAQAGVDPTVWERELQAEAGRVVAEAGSRVAALSPGTVVHRLVAPEDPRALLLGLSREAAVTVVGSRGRGRVESLLLGSTSASLARHARGPVVVVRPGGPAPGEGRGVLVAVDGYDTSSAALEAAYAMASVRGLPLTVLHCTWDARALTDALPDPAAPVDVLEEGRLLVAEAVAGLGEKYPDVDVATTVVHGRVPGQVTAAAEGMDLTVVGHHRRSRLGAWLLGSVAVDVLERARGAVVVVPDAR